MDWIHTLEARFAGRHHGFIDANTPLEDQDEAAGGVNAPSPTDGPAEPDAAAEPDAPATTLSDAVAAEDAPSSSRSRSK
jgi:hypothetical protein